MPKVSRVIYNRLAVPMKLEFDSTVNYALDRASIATTAEDRANPSPYNTYQVMGLPPTPISSPGPDAVDAALNPAEGSWLFFVKVEPGGRVLLQRHRRAARGLRRAGKGQRCLRLTAAATPAANGTGVIRRPRCSARRSPTRCRRRCTGPATRRPG